MKNPCDKMEILRQIEPLEKNSPHSRVFVVTARGGAKCCVKRYGRDEKQLRWVLEVIEHLRQKGFQETPELVFLENGRPFFQAGDSFYYLTRWVEGPPADFRRLKDIQHAARLLARLHLLSAGFNPSNPVPSRVSWGRLPDTWQERLRGLENFALTAEREFKDDFDRLFLSLLPDALLNGEASLRNLEGDTYPELVEEAKAWSGICHQDFAQQNLIWECRRLVAIDMDNCKCDLPVRDLCRLLKRIFAHQPCDPYRFKLALRAYSQVRPLDNRELILFSQLLLFPHDLWRIAYDRYQKRPERHRHLNRDVLLHWDNVKLIDLASKQGFYQQMAAELAYSDSLTM